MAFASSVLPALRPCSSHRLSSHPHHDLHHAPSHSKLRVPRHPRAVLDSIDSHTNPHDSQEAIHGRLGIQSLWLPATHPTTDTSQKPSTASHSAHSAHSAQAPATSSVPASTSVAHQPFLLHTPITASPLPDDAVSHPWDTTNAVHAVSYLDRRVSALRKRQSLLARSYEECRRITNLFSKTFYMGTSLLSPEKRRAVWAIYTWCRRTDDLVDSPRVVQRSEALHRTLDQWRGRLLDIFAGKPHDSLDLALSDAISHFPDLTPQPFLDMIDGMVMDVRLDRFQTFDDLYLYCYRVAGTVGLMTLPIMGVCPPDRTGLHAATHPAIALGIALQLTNILRDVGEDRLRGRIYLPLEDLRRFNYSEQDLFDCVLDSRYRALIKFQINRARSYYKQAELGVPLLSEDSRLPVQASLDMYSQILDEVEQNGYDNFNRRAYVSKSKKLLTVPLSLMRIQQGPSWKSALKVAEFVMGKTSISNS